MVKIERTIESKRDLPPEITKLNKKDQINNIKEITTFNYQKGEVLTTIEELDCGHVNNLKLKNRVSGKCPKGCV